MHCPIGKIQSVCCKLNGPQPCAAEIVPFPSHNTVERRALREKWGCLESSAFITLHCLHYWSAAWLNPLDIHSCYRSKLSTSSCAHPENHLFKNSCEDMPLTQTICNSSKLLCESHIPSLQKLSLLCSYLRCHKRSMTWAVGWKKKGG